MKTIPIEERYSKVDRSHEAPAPAPISLDFLDRFPDLLAARSLKILVRRIIKAHELGRPVIFTMGAHPIKCGLTPVLIELMRKGVLTGIATNGAAVVHDIEMSLFGQTSEEVLPSLQTGTFGATRETHEIFQKILARYEFAGLGESVGAYLGYHHQLESKRSLFAVADNLGIPITVHVTLGADILHMNERLDAGRLGQKSMRDFHLFQARISRLGKDGVLVNWGSAVTMPEVILKAIGMGRNQGQSFRGVTMADLDMIRSYRATTRIVDVANELGGTGLSITGHHEILLPLVAGLVLGGLES